MEMKTVEMINSISSIDKEVYPMVLLRLNETILWLYEKIEDDVELERCLSLLMHRDRNMRPIKCLLEYCGFEQDDERIEEIIDEYCKIPEGEKDILLLKKQLIEWAIELENIDI